MDLVAGIAYSFYAHDQTPGVGNGTTELSLFDAAGTLLAHLGSFIVDNPSFSFTPTTAGTYFIGVDDLIGYPGQYSVGVTAIAESERFLSGADDDYTGLANERILGRRGDDHIDLGLGLDALGEQGDDFIAGNDSVNFISGGVGNDTVIGEGGNDNLFGDAGDDSISGGDGADRIFGGDGTDLIDGGDGLNVIHGGNGVDKIRGGIDADAFYGDSGNDS
ncbi:MAG: calcium-binding protein, partial [Bradyrhizobium sp.]